jgi:hypothetical protein
VGIPGVQGLQGVDGVEELAALHRVSGLGLPRLLSTAGHRD